MDGQNNGAIWDWNYTTNQPSTFDLLEKKGGYDQKTHYILSSITRHSNIGNNLHLTKVSTILKALQKDLRIDTDKQPHGDHSFKVGGAFDVL